MLIKLLSIFFTFASLNKYSISYIEKIALSFIFEDIEPRVNNPYLILLSRLVLCNRDIFFQVFFTFNLFKFINLILNNFYKTLSLLTILLCILKLQNCISNIKSISRVQRINLNRKLFHFVCFCVFYNPSDFLIELSEYAFFGFILTSKSKLFRMFFRNFLSAKDCNNVLFSHVYLLMSCLFPYYYLELENYRSTLMAVCILDSMASIVGLYFKNTSKSFLGSISGVLSAVIVNLYCYKKTNFFYFLFVGLIEYIDLCNDNLSIPLFSICYYKIKKVI
ncbi:dolichol kinase [Vairimorpha ceranae]|uniref:Dolichol kinase n=1 Tax=Vairimorpha ceranae TaxID=40302 RepID=A0A0F9WH79_9MICR|nr:dolichol kinase [Vairimorpha ceranae]KAF5140711.1 hypothetical protein G9O61_00g012070 [Vairimorpha ceranae]KKO75985.1 dolichol kinase [Vairimorpha ceranae]